MAETRRALPGLRSAALAPAGPDGVERVLSQRFGLWKPRERSEAEWRAYWADYHTILQEMPYSALEAGMVAWLRSGGARPPFPGEWLSLAKDTKTPEAEAYARARHAVTLADAEPSKREIIPKEQMAALMATFQKDMDRGRERRLADHPATRQKPLGPPISAPVGETGVSAELLHQIYGGDDAASIQAEG